MSTAERIRAMEGEIKDWRNWRAEVRKHLIREGEWRENMRNKLEDLRGVAGDVVAESDDARAALVEMFYEERMKWQSEMDELSRYIQQLTDELESCHSRRDGASPENFYGGGGRRGVRDRDSRGNSQRDVKKHKKTKRRSTRKRTQKIKRKRTQKIKRKRTQKKKLSNKR